MAEPSNHGKKWTPVEVQKLKELAKGNTPTRVIALKLHRTPLAIESKAGGAKHQPQTDQPVAL